MTMPFDDDDLKTPEDAEGRPLPMLAAIEVVRHIKNNGYRKGAIMFKLSQAERDLMRARRHIGKKPGDHTALLAQIATIEQEIAALRMSQPTAPTGG